MDWSCQSFINPIGELQLLQKAENNVRQAWVPHEMTHGPMAIIKNFAGSNNKCHQKQGTQKYSASHHSHACWAERADNGNPRHAQPPAHPNGQSLSTKPETKQGICHLWATESMALAPDQTGVNLDLKASPMRMLVTSPRQAAHMRAANDLRNYLQLTDSCWDRL